MALAPFLPHRRLPHLNMEMSGEDSVLLVPFVMESVVRRHNIFRKKYVVTEACRSTRPDA